MSHWDLEVEITMLSGIVLFVAITWVGCGRTDDGYDVVSDLTAVVKQIQGQLVTMEKRFDDIERLVKNVQTDVEKVKGQ